MARRLTWRIGRRGAVLILFGIVYVFLGIGYMGPLPETTTDQLVLALNWGMPIQFWGACWLGVGILGLINAFYPPGKDSYGFITMGLMAYLWSAFLIVGWVQYQPPRALILGFLMASFGAALTIIAGWAEPRGDVVRHRRNAHA